MFHTIYIVVCVTKEGVDGEICNHTTALNHKDTAEGLMKTHKELWGNRLIYCGITEHSIFIG